MIARSASWLRSSTAGGFLLVRRRALHDASAVLVWTTMVTVAILLSITGPWYLSAVVDAGAREVVESAGTTGDLLVETPVGSDSGGIVDASAIEDTAAEVARRLPRALRLTVAEPTLTVEGQNLLVEATDVNPVLDNPLSRLRLAPYLATTANTAALSLVDGELPGDAVSAEGPIPVLLSESAARVSSLDVGSILSLPIADADNADGAPLQIEVVGIANELPTRDAAGSGSPWEGIEEMWQPSVLSDGRSTVLGFGVLMSPASVERLTRSQGSSFTALIRFPLDPERVTSDLLVESSMRILQLVANSERIDVDGFIRFEVSSGLPDVAAGFRDSARATLAELSLIVAGVIGATAAVLLLASRLLAVRRLRDTLLTSARGSSHAAILVRALGEALVVIVIAALLALGVARILGVETLDDPLPLALVVGIAAIAGPAQLLTAVRAASVTAHVGVNRRDAIRRVRIRRAARLAPEVAVLVLAAGATIALLDRGLDGLASGGIDPLVASAPVLAAAAVTIVVLRLSDLLLPLAAASALRSRGIAGPIVASRLSRGLAAVPAIAVTITVALIVCTGLIQATVKSGQLDAAWQAVGADLRIEGGVDSAAVDTVAAGQGVVVASGFSGRSAQLELSSNSARVTLVSVDGAYAGFVSALPAIEGVTDATDADAFALLGDSSAAGPLPAVIDASVSARLLSDEVSVTVDGETIPLLVVGTVAARPGVPLDGPLVFVDLADLAARVSSPVTVDSLVALGSGAVEAAAGVESAASTTVTRAGWLEDRRGSALIAGVDTGILAGVVLLVLLGLAAIVCTALAGSPERARSLALLRTLGVHRRFGVLLAVIDQVPLLIASLLGGIAAGLGMTILFLPALGLEFLTGGLSAPALTVPGGFLPVVGAAVLLVFAIGTLIEVVLRRRDQPSDTIRQGGMS